MLFYKQAKIKKLKLKLNQLQQKTRSVGIAGFESRVVSVQQPLKGLESTLLLTVQYSQPCYWKCSISKEVGSVLQVKLLVSSMTDQPVVICVHSLQLQKPTLVFITDKCSVKYVTPSANVHWPILQCTQPHASWDKWIYTVLWWWVPTLEILPHYAKITYPSCLFWQSLKYVWWSLTFRNQGLPENISLYIMHASRSLYLKSCLL